MRPPWRKTMRQRLMTEPSNIVDVFVGARLRMRRMILGMSQSKLGELLGVCAV